MKRISLFTLVFFTGTIVFGGEFEKTISTQVEEVTVFIEGAQIVHSSDKVQLPAGHSVIKLEDLTYNLDVSSLRVTGLGDFTLMSVDHKFNFLGESSEKRLEELEAQLEDIQHEITLQNVTLDVNHEEEDLLMQNKSLKGEETGVDVSQLIQASNFYRQRLSELKNEQVYIDKRINELREKEQLIQNEMSELQKGENDKRSEVFVRVWADRSTEASFEISYFAYEAGWYPFYDLRVSKVNQPISAQLNANVHQSTGIDWTGVDIELSTGNPTLESVKPILAPHYLDFSSHGSYTYTSSYGNYNSGVRQVSGVVMDASTGEPIPFANVLVEGTTVGTTTDFDGRYMINIPSGSQHLVVSYIGYTKERLPISSQHMNISLREEVLLLDAVVITSSKRTADGYYDGGRSDNFSEVNVALPPSVETRTDVTSKKYKIDIPYTILSNGKNYTIAIEAKQIGAAYQYATVPKLNPSVFLTARLTDWVQYELLDAETNIYFEGTYIGKSLIDTRSAEDTIDISLGVDNAVIVQRNLLSEKNKRTGLSDKEKKTRYWEVVLRNTRSQPLYIMVEDQFPVSKQKNIEVTLLESSGARVNELTGQLIWMLTLMPGQTQNLEFGYEVRYPKHQRVGLD